jgi:hypothetical protein
MDLKGAGQSERKSKNTNPCPKPASQEGFLIPPIHHPADHCQFIKLAISQIKM